MTHANPVTGAISSDMLNAFGRMRHLLIARGILKHFPLLFPLFSWAYSIPFHFRYSDGELALLAKLQELEQLQLDVPPTGDDAAPVKIGVIAYMDDLTVYARFYLTGKVVEILHEVTEAASILQSPTSSLAKMHPVFQKRIVSA